MFRATAPAITPCGRPLNLSSHKRTAVRRAIERAGLQMHLFQDYNSDLNPVEIAFSTLKAFP
ncbi:MAG: transposase [Roseitalea sp.]|nr:transposase [Roseitalea sp.]MBO6951482.1 transposase [Rhizobiaceae bacterium]MBO6592672.1 transposase [Roseitalea sp.]MBO6598927.1 transposase [Roseitalea sp.]MBO6611373.1 transposase [Roseitalea sp.]